MEIKRLEFNLSKEDYARLIRLAELEKRTIRMEAEAILVEAMKQRELALKKS